MAASSEDSESEKSRENRRISPNSINPLSKSSSLHKIVTTLIAERRKEKEIDEDYILVNNNTSSDAFWTAVFSKYFLIKADSVDGSRDDLVFFVRNTKAEQPMRRVGSSSNLTHCIQNEKVQVFRKDGRNMPSLGDPAYIWEETVYLNLILQQFEYTLTCAICSRTGDRELEILRRVTQKVYASPSHREMDSKGTGEVIVYPDIFFTVDNFEEVFGDLVVHDSEMVCVELVASDRNGEFQAVIFIGSIRYEAIHTVFESKQSTLSSKMRQSFSWGSQAKLTGRRTEFIRMRGPQGKGYAEMAISRMRGVPDTPLTTPLVTPLHTPATTPGATPEREDLPPFPTTSSDQTHIEPTSQSASSSPYKTENRRMSESYTSSPFRGGFKWGFGIKKSQSAQEELHQTGSGLFGKSFGQAWHWFKEQRRAASIGLNPCLTYVTLPWHRIIADILDNQRTPILSF